MKLGNELTHGCMCTKVCGYIEERVAVKACVRQFFLEGGSMFQITKHLKRFDTGLQGSVAEAKILLSCLKYCALTGCHPPLD